MENRLHQRVKITKYNNINIFFQIDELKFLDKIYPITRLEVFTSAKPLQ